MEYEPRRCPLMWIHWCKVLRRCLSVHFPNYMKDKFFCISKQMGFTSPALVEADAHWAVTVRSPDTRTSPRSEASIPGHLLIRKRYIFLIRGKDISSFLGIDRRRTWVLDGMKLWISRDMAVGLIIYLQYNKKTSRPAGPEVPEHSSNDKVYRCRRSRKPICGQCLVHCDIELHQKKSSNWMADRVSECQRIPAIDCISAVAQLIPGKATPSAS